MYMAKVGAEFIASTNYEATCRSSVKEKADKRLFFTAENCKKKISILSKIKENNNTRRMVLFKISAI